MPYRLYMRLEYENQPLLARISPQSQTCVFARPPQGSFHSQTKLRSVTQLVRLRTDERTASGSVPANSRGHSYTYRPDLLEAPIKARPGLSPIVLLSQIHTIKQLK